MLTVHPIVQSTAILLACYTFLLGMARFRSVHLGQKTRFKWKQHVLMGKIALGVLLSAAIGGMLLVYLYWHGLMITGIHGKVGLFLCPFIVFGLASGIYMDKNRKQRKILNLLHGLNNCIILILALSQIVTGIKVYKMFVMGG